MTGTDRVMCQSIVSPSLGTAPCQLHASRVLVGVHLCGAHERRWRRLVANGSKIRIHPERALPVDHHCSLIAEPDRTCVACGETKPAASFYRYSHSTSRVLRCAQCWNAADKRRKRQPVSTEPELETDHVQAEPEPPAEPESHDLTAPPQATRELRPASRDRYLYEVEFVCSMCARWVCDVRVADPKALIQLPSTTRCGKCGGVPLRSGEVTERYVGPNGRALWAAAADDPLEIAS